MPTALAVLRDVLPHGDNGRIVNSFIFPDHPDAVAYQRDYWCSLRDGARGPLAAIFEGDIHGCFLLTVYGGWGAVHKCDACGEIMQVTICNPFTVVNPNTTDRFNVQVFTHESGLLYSGCTQCREHLAGMEEEREMDRGKVFRYLG